MAWPFGRSTINKITTAFGAPAPAKRAYAGSTFGRLVADWVATSTSVDAEVKSSLRALRNRSRQLGRDNDYVRGFLKSCETNIIGEGIPFQSQIKMQRGNKMNAALNDAIETAWFRWARKDSCHTAGQLAFNDIERLLIRSVAESGEVFVRLVRQPFGRSKIPFSLEILEADLLDEDHSGRAVNGNEVRMGVEVDSWGRPVAYHFHQKHPGDYHFQVKQVSGRTTVRIPAEEIIALQLFERPGQTRAVPWLASSIIRLHHIGGYEEAEVIAARASASLMGFIETPEGELLGDDVYGVDRVTEFEPGVFKKLAPGERVQVPDLHRTGGEFDPFLRAMLRGVAAGAGTSYATISRDYSQSNFSSSRMDLLNERDNWRVLQRWMIRNFHEPVFAAWLDMAVLSGVLKLPGYELDPERYQMVKFMPRGWAWIDPQREVSAAKDAILGGLSTLTSEAAQRGEDIEELFIQRARELELAKTHGLTLDTDAANTKQPIGPGRPQVPVEDEE